MHGLKLNSVEAIVHGLNRFEGIAALFLAKSTCASVICQTLKPNPCKKHFVHNLVCVHKS